MKALDKALLKDMIFDAKDLNLVKLDVPEWGGFIYLKPFSAYDILTLSKKETKEGEFINEACRSIVKAVVNENGETIFTEDDIKELSKKSYKVILKITTKINELNQAGDLESAEKN